MMYCALNKPLPINALCQSFQALAIRTWLDLRDSHAAHLIRDEETITNEILLYLARCHPNEVSIVQFDKPRESIEGADWEWWFGAHNGWFGMRVQAKRLDIPNLHYMGINRKIGTKAKAPLQIDTLIRRAASTSCYPIYCFYNFWQLGAFLSNWRCGSFPPVSELLGCAIGSATRVKDCMASKTSLKVIDSIAMPWHCLVCCTNYAADGASLPYRTKALVESVLADDNEIVPDVISSLPSRVSSLLEIGGREDTTLEVDDPTLRGIFVLNEREGS